MQRETCFTSGYIPSPQFKVYCLSYFSSPSQFYLLLSTHLVFFLVPYANFTPHNLRVMSFKDIVQNTLPFVSKKNTPVSYLPVEDKERDKSNDTSRQGSDEGESFIPKKMLAPPQRSWLTYWRMGLEVLLVLTSVITLFFTLIYDKPLKQRQVECGRLLGQWRM